MENLNSPTFPNGNSECEICNKGKYVSKQRGPGFEYVYSDFLKTYIYLMLIWPQLVDGYVDVFH